MTPTYGHKIDIDTEGTLKLHAVTIGVFLALALLAEKFTKKSIDI